MTEHDNTNTGALFRNDKGENPKRPDYRGKIDVEGRSFKVSGWIRESKAGQKYMRLALEPEVAQAPQASQEPIRQSTGGNQPEPDDCDPLPF
jgi:uncharacterized protein (DUF736 family)